MPGGGGTALDQEIVRWQGEVRKPGQPESLRLIAIEKLGWLFIAQARAQDDDGAYTLAEQCAFALTTEQPGSPAAMLLRGHVLQQFHRFKEAEALARQLVAVRKLPYDYGLLGDCLMEQGRLEEAIPAYQTMVDLKPGFESFVRAAHMRWLKGDLRGARELMGQVLGMIHPRRAGHVGLGRSPRRPLRAPGRGPPRRPSARRNRPPGQAKRRRGAPGARPGRSRSRDGKMRRWNISVPRLGPGRYRSSCGPWRTTSKPGNSRPKLPPSSKPCGRLAAARTPAPSRFTSPPPGRTLPTPSGWPGRNWRARQEVFTWDALAWSQFAAGEVTPARESMRHALAEGTRDGRLFMHAAVIAAAAGAEAEEQEFAVKAASLKQMLLPSERRLLDGLAGVR